MPKTGSCLSLEKRSTIGRKVKFDTLDMSQVIDANKIIRMATISLKFSRYAQDLFLGDE